MSVLGIGCSDRERITIFNNPPRHFSSPLDQEIAEAQEEAEAKWREYVHRVDGWMERGEYDQLKKFGDECEALDNKVLALCKRRSCQHINTHEEGSVRFGYGDLIDDTCEICDDCGKRL